MEKLRKGNSLSPGLKVSEDSESDNNLSVQGQKISQETIMNRTNTVEIPGFMNATRKLVIKTNIQP
mgnify:CR=1 FL=1